MKKRNVDVLRISPDQRLCPLFDQTGFAMYPTANFCDMGVVVADDCPQEHIQ